MKKITILLLMILSIPIQAQTVYDTTFTGSRQYKLEHTVAKLESLPADGRKVSNVPESLPLKNKKKATSTKVVFSSYNQGLY